LLLVKSRGSYEHPAIVTAVDPLHSHGKPASLDRRLLSVGNSWARLLNGQSHAFHAFAPIAIAVPLPSAQPMAGWLAPEIEDLHANRVMRAFQDLAGAANIYTPRRHLSVGDVPHELERIVQQTNARIVVLGAVSRGALWRPLIGSTAERVLDGLTCDVLIVKPLSSAAQAPPSKIAQSLHAA
jgi:universal stress protein E